jgi:hypothetical protein
VFCPSDNHMDRIVKVSLSVGILLVGISASYYFIFALPAIQKQRLAAQVMQTMLEQDQQCSKGAKEFFDANGFANNKSALADEYENHFNKRLNKCFVLVRINTLPGNALFLHRALFDVYDGKTIAEYDKRVPIGTAEYEVKPFSCSMLDKNCQTDEEFDAFVKTYMEP